MKMHQFVCLCLMIGFAMVDPSVGCHRAGYHGRKPGVVNPTSASYIRGFLTKHGASEFIISCTINRLGNSDSLMSSAGSSMEEARGRSKRFLRDQVKKDVLIGPDNPELPIGPEYPIKIKTESLFEHCGDYQNICNAAKACYEEEKRKFSDFIGPKFEVDERRPY